ncbi:unnamed protein product [Pedinophyceae sp. YPF-701]|nr:unnamed protein product [Pedinophyceae sp. YPF-701]
MGLDSGEVERQLAHMIRFIKQEAEEKANELQFEAEEEFNISKLQLVEAEKARIRKEYARKQHQLEAKKKVEASQQLNAVRLQMLQAKHALVQSTASEARNQLVALTRRQADYKTLLTRLIAQAMTHMEEKSVKVRCREVDQGLVQAVIENARAEYKKAVGKEAPAATLDTAKFLPPPPTGKEEEGAKTCLGGVAVTSEDGRIVCSNTLDHRLEIVLQQNLPNVRSALFGDE